MIKVNHRLLPAVLIGVSALVLPDSARTVQAQELALEEIVVTARKLEENLMEVPVAITAFTADTLESIDMAQLTDVQLYTPSFSFTNQQGGSGRNDRSSNALVFRGLYLGANTGITAGGQVFIDGAPIIGGYMPSIVDTERLEILKGPQSAHFGRSTFVGALNFIMKEPGNEFKGKASASYSRFDSNEQSLSIEAPIIEDKLAIRLSGRHWRQGGYIDNFTDPASPDLGARTTNSVSTTIVMTPADDWKVKLFVNYFQDKDFAGAQFSLKEESFNGRARPDGTCDPMTASPRAGLAGTRAGFGYYCGTLPSVSEVRGVTPEIFSADTVLDSILQTTLFSPPPRWTVFDPDFHQDPGLKRNAFQANMRIDHDNSSGYSFTSNTAYHKDKGQNIIDLNYRDGRSRVNPFGFLFRTILGRTDVRPDWNTTLLIQQKQEDWSQEFRVVSPQDERIRWTAGFNYFEASSPGGTVYGNLIIGPFFTAAITQRNIKTPAVFGGAYFDITPVLTLSAEARYQWDKVSEEVLIARNGFPPTNPTVNKATFKSFAPRVSLDWNYAENSTAYVLFSRGYRPGRFNAVLQNASAEVLTALAAVVPGAGLEIQEEKLDNYEIGLKSTWLNGRARTTISAFYDEWLNGQVQNSIPIVADGVANLISLTVNTGKARLRGFEFEGAFQATENLTFNGSIGLNDTSVQAYVCGDCNLVWGTFDGVEGNNLPAVPKTTWSVSGEYTDLLRMPSGEAIRDYEWYGRFDWAHQGSRFADFSNVAKTSAYDNLNLRLGIRTAAITVETFVLNAMNHDEFIQAGLGVDLFTFISGPNKNEVRLSAPIPRTWGLRVSYNF